MHVKKQLIIQNEDGTVEFLPVKPKNPKNLKTPKKQLIIQNEDGTVEILRVKPAKKVVTEDLGKIFEMAICLLYSISYDGNYKYSMEAAQEITNKLSKLKEIFDHTLIHTAKGCSRYDFTSETYPNIQLSAKTSKKKDGKVCPQVIGQPTKKKFCQYFNLDISTTKDQIKDYIINNIYKLLEEYFNYTFDCPIVYYNENNNKILFIKKIENIVWTKFTIEFSHITNSKIWNESSTIKINGHSIGEFQMHNNRNGIKFRWHFEKLMDVFPENFNIMDV